MSFVTVAPTEAEKARLDPAHFPVPYVLEWTVDRERDIYMIKTRGGGPDDSTNEFVMRWNGIHVSALTTSPMYGAPIGTCEILHVSVPIGHEERREQARSLFAEALGSFGHYFHDLVFRTRTP